MTQLERRKTANRLQIVDESESEFSDLDLVLEQPPICVNPNPTFNNYNYNYAADTDGWPKKSGRSDSDYEAALQAYQQDLHLQDEQRKKQFEERKQAVLAEVRAKAQVDLANRQKRATTSASPPVPASVATKGPAQVHAAPPTAGPNRSNSSARPTKGDAYAASDILKPIEYYPLFIETIPPPNYEFIQDNLSLENAIDVLMQEKVISVDTETSGLDPFDSHLLLVQVASPEKCYIVDATKVNLGPLKRLLESEHNLKLLQNAKFDYKMLKAQAGIELSTVYDTYLAEKVLTAGTGAVCRLDEIVYRYLGVQMDKSVRKSFIGQSHANMSPEQLAYAAKDVMALFPIYSKQLQRLKKEKAMLVADLEFRCVMSVGDLELNGCLLHVTKWREILEGVSKKRDAVRDELMTMLPGGSTKQSSMFGTDEYLINLNSGQQIIAEFKKLGIELEDTSEATLMKHATEPNGGAVKKLLEYRGHEKTLGSFGEGLLAQIHKKTGRIHPDFQQYGADTGRFSCSNPNVQQIPATSDFRSCFIPEPGYKLVTSDYSQAELRILAQLTKDPGFVTAFNDGIDLHILAASQMFQVPFDQVSKPMRSQAKAINFGLAYGMGPQGLAVRIDKTVEEARALIDQYFKAFSGVQKWLTRTGRESVRNGYSDTPLGRKRFFQPPDRDDPERRRKEGEIERAGKNHPIQGCNADMTKMALIFLREKLKGYNARIVNTVHDEIVVEVIENQAEDVRSIVEREMIRAGQEVLKDVPVVVDAKVGDYWSK